MPSPAHAPARDGPAHLLETAPGPAFPARSASQSGLGRVWRRIRRFLIPLLLALTLFWFGLLSASLALADTLDEVELSAEGEDTRVRISFNLRIQYLRHVPSASGDLLQVFFQIVGDSEGPSVAPELRQVHASALSPAISVTYPLQPTAVTKKLLVRFARPMKFKVRPGGDNRSIEILLERAAVSTERKATPEAVRPGAPGAAPSKYAIVLDTFATSDMSQARPIPPELADYVVFTRRSTSGRTTRYELALGYFSTPQEAEPVRRRVAAAFPAAKVIELPALTPLSVPSPLPPSETAQRPGAAAAQPTPAETTLPAPAPAPTPAPAAETAQTPAAAATDVEARAANLIQQSRQALSAGKHPQAIETLNQLLFLPPNKQSQEAQELIGVAREAIGETGKARAEYELYLKLYPEGEGAQRVRNRLAKLGAAKPAKAVDGDRRAPKPTLRTFNGSVSQYYYDGETRTQSAFNTPTTVDQATLTSKDLSSLVTNVDLTARVRSESSDTRLVVRDTSSLSFLDTNPSRNRLNAAYVDYRSLERPVMLRAGRQVGVSGGVNGRFDGAIAGYGFAPKWRVNAVAGTPVDFQIDSTRYFYGLNVDAENLWDRWGGNAFVINQIVDGITDRRAVGAELRYFDGVRTVYSLIDYDISFREVNIAMLQASWQTQRQTVFNLLLDRRKAPTLATSNAVIGQQTTSVSTLLQTMSVDQVRQQALALTADVTQVLAGVTTPLGSNWQLGADYRLTNVGALPAVNDIPATPATGNIHSYTLQGIGNNLYSKRDISVFNVTLQQGPTFHGEYFSYNNVTALNAKWTLEPSIRLYFQRDDLGVKLDRITPGLRVTYRVRERVALEAELDWERSRTSSATQTDTSTRRFFYVGYRVDF